MFKKLLDKIFPMCRVLRYGRYVGKKRIFILKYWWNNR